MLIPIVDVEIAFADFVEEYGGIVSDRLGEAPDKPKNADYIFHDAKVIAELKLLKEDPLTNKDFIKSRTRKTNEWLHKGYITEQQLSQVTKINQLPDTCYRDIVKLYMRPVKYHLEQANKQIKATKLSMDLPDYKGLVFIASDGNYFIEPRHASRFIASILDNETIYKSISTAVYLTVNVVTTRPDDQSLSRLWVNLYRDKKHFENVPLAFLKDIYNNWVEYYNELTGADLDNISEMNEEGLTEDDFLARTRFVKPIKLE
ncbi:MAG TPA: hypothetical protein VJU86_13850 [Pyrinomonadaceae bacterium]|nr:hypothetical protein [Pyrinomonadaceae bacterium]